MNKFNRIRNQKCLGRVLAEIYLTAKGLRNQIMHPSDKKRIGVDYSDVLELGDGSVLQKPN